jgi:serpin B
VEVPADDQAALRDANRGFALDLYATVAGAAPADENVFLCPLGISTVLSMTYAGARGDTATELASVLHWDLGADALHPAVNGLHQSLRAGTENTAVRFDTVNSIWLAQDHGTADPFLDVLSQHYDTGVYLVDYAGDAEGARQSINEWVGDQTDGLIDELFAPGALAANTELTLANAALLSAPWRERFDVVDTQPGEFILPDGNAVDVQVMSRVYQYPFAFDVDWRAAELRFRDASMGMVFVLPNAGEFDEFEANLDSVQLEEIVTALEAAPADGATGASLWLQVPRFDFSASVDLRPPLETLGLQSAFDLSTADFSGIDSAGELYVDALVHRTTVGVDEEGTTAAAATGEVLRPLSLNPTISLDRPFIFFIYDHDTGTVLFLGRLVRPAGDAHAPSDAPDARSDAEIICDSLVECQGRTVTQAECVTALADADQLVLDQCADCHQMGLDLCAGIPGCAFGPDICDPTTCADYCPSTAF